MPRSSIPTPTSPAAGGRRRSPARGGRQCEAACCGAPAELCGMASLCLTIGPGCGLEGQLLPWPPCWGPHQWSPGPVLSPSWDAALSLGVGGGRNAHLEGSKVKQRFQVSKHFPNTRFAVIRGSSFMQLHRDYFSILVCVLGLSSAGSLLSCLWSRAA